MSIARRVTLRRLLGTGAATLAFSAALASVASATDCPGGKGWQNGGSYKPGTGAGSKTETDRCEFSLDGKNFFASVKVDDLNLKPTDDGKVHVKVRAAGDASTCTASLASYRAHGPTFATSGEQVFHDFDTVTVKAGAVDSSTSRSRTSAATRRSTSTGATRSSTASWTPTTASRTATSPRARTTRSSRTS